VNVLPDAIAPPSIPLNFCSGRGDLSVTLSGEFDDLDGLHQQAQYVFVRVASNRIEQLFAEHHTAHRTGTFLCARPLFFKINDIEITAAVTVEGVLDADVLPQVPDVLSYALELAAYAARMLLRCDELDQGNLLSIDALDALVAWATDARCGNFELQLAELKPAA
jgi:hypothetical protein